MARDRLANGADPRRIIIALFAAPLAAVVAWCATLLIAAGPDYRPEVVEEQLRVMASGMTALVYIGSLLYLWLVMGALLTLRWLYAWSLLLGALSGVLVIVFAVTWLMVGGPVVTLREMMRGDALFAAAIALAFAAPMAVTFIAVAGLPWSRRSTQALFDADRLAGV
jgi:hypothetical protein